MTEINENQTPAPEVEMAEAPPAEGDVQLKLILFLKIAMSGEDQKMTNTEDQAAQFQKPIKTCRFSMHLFVLFQVDQIDIGKMTINDDPDATAINPSNAEAPPTESQEAPKINTAEVVHFYIEC